MVRHSPDHKPALEIHLCSIYSFREKRELTYAHADKRAKFWIAAENQRKRELVCEHLENHAGESIPIIGQSISHLERLAKSLGLPIITGKTRHDEERLMTHL